jgi:hypothetical protein
MGLKEFEGLVFLGESSEKGSTRKYTGNWVTRWKELFWGNFKVLRCFAKRIFLEEFKLALFGGFGGGST